MKKIASIAFSFVIVLLFFTFFPVHTYSQNKVSVKAGVGKYYFTASGFVSPYASVVMTQDSYFMSSVTADKNGYFLLDPALVNEGFAGFCLEAVDFRRIGTSYTCFNIEPVKTDYSLKKIFLPPTVGLSGRKITPNSSIQASGYGMPLSLIKVSIGDNRCIEAWADKNGYYNTEVKNISPGTYVLYATATYENKNSETPTRKFKIESVGLISTISGRFWPLLLFVLILFLIIPLIIFLKRRRKKRQGKKVNQSRASSA